MDQFVFEDETAKATGAPLEIKKSPRFKIFKGSTARKIPSRTERRYDDERRQLIADGTLTDHPSVSGLLEFTRDYEANSASMAAGVISGGGNFSGPEKWFEVASGEPFNEWLGKRL
jgi:hypothetical protein